MAQTQSKVDRWLYGAGQNFKAMYGFDLGARILLGGEPLNLETAARAGVSAVGWALLGPFGPAAALSQPLLAIGKSLGTSYARSNAEWGRHYQKTEFNREAAYTMRQRAIQAIQGSKLNARSALGNEASLMHR